MVEESAHTHEHAHEATPYTVVPLFRVPIYRQKWVEHEDGTFSNSLALTHAHRPATTHSLVFDLGMVVILSSLTKRFHVPPGLDPPTDNRFLAFLSGNNPWVLSGWAVHDVVMSFLPIFHRWRASIRFWNFYDAGDVVFLLFWAVELALLIAAGMHTSCTTDIKCREGCWQLSATMALWTTAQLVMSLYATIANTCEPCVRYAVRRGGAEVAGRTMASHLYATHRWLFCGFYVVYYTPSIVLWASVALLWGVDELSPAQCSAAEYTYVNHPALATLWAATVWEWVVCPVIFILFAIIIAKCAVTKPSSPPPSSFVTVAADERDSSASATATALERERPSILSAMNLAFTDDVTTAAQADEARELRADAGEARGRATTPSVIVKMKHLLFPQDIDLTVERYGLLCVLCVVALMPRARLRTAARTRYCCVSARLRTAALTRSMPRRSRYRSRSHSCFIPTQGFSGSLSSRRRRPSRATATPAAVQLLHPRRAGATTARPTRRVRTTRRSPATAAAAAARTVTSRRRASETARTTSAPSLQSSR